MYEVEKRLSFELNIKCIRSPIVVGLSTKLKAEAKGIISPCLAGDPKHELRRATAALTVVLETCLVHVQRSLSAEPQQH